jgi:hypothetical protein
MFLKRKNNRVKQNLKCHEHYCSSTVMNIYGVLSSAEPLLSVNPLDFGVHLNLKSWSELSRIDLTSNIA